MKWTWLREISTSPTRWSIRWSQEKRTKLWMICSARSPLSSQNWLRWFKKSRMTKSCRFASWLTTICRKLSRDSIVSKRALSRVTLSLENPSRTHRSRPRISTRKKKRNRLIQAILNTISPKKLKKLATFSTLLLQPNLNLNSPKTPCFNLSILNNHSNNSQFNSNNNNKPSLKDKLLPRLMTP